MFVWSSVPLNMVGKMQWNTYSCWSACTVNVKHSSDGNVSAPMWFKISTAAIQLWAKCTYQAKIHEEWRLFHTKWHFRGRFSPLAMFGGWDEKCPLWQEEQRQWVMQWPTDWMNVPCRLERKWLDLVWGEILSPFQSIVYPFMKNVVKMSEFSNRRFLTRTSRQRIQ